MPPLTDGLEDPRRHGLSPVPTCSHFGEESRYKAAAINAKMATQQRPQVVAGVVLAVALAVVYVWITSTPRVYDAAAISQCRQLYGSAKTHADTLAIDAIHPLQQTTGDSDRLPCGTFRTTGKL